MSPYGIEDFDPEDPRFAESPAAQVLSRYSEPSAPPLVEAGNDPSEGFEGVRGTPEVPTQRNPFQAPPPAVARPKLAELLGAAQAQDVADERRQRVRDAIQAAGLRKPFTPAKSETASQRAMALRQAELQDDALAAKDAQLQTESDPNSPASQSMRALIAKTLPGIERQVPNFDQLPSGRLKELFPMFREAMEQASARDKWRLMMEQESRKNERERAEEQSRFERGLSAEDARNARNFEQQKQIARIQAGIREEAEDRRVGREQEKAKVASSDLLRKEFDALPEVKTFKEIDAAYSKMKHAVSNPSAGGDLALIFQFMKMLDPGSTVREGEFANAQNATGVPDKIRNQFNKLLDGERMNPRQRADFLAQAKAFHDAHRKQYEKASRMYAGLAEKRSVPGEDVVGSAPGRRRLVMPDGKTYEEGPDGKMREVGGGP